MTKAVMIEKLKSFAAFWYDFVVGDDWQVAVGVIVGLAATYGLVKAGVPAWWVMPVAVAVLLSTSLLRATRAARRG
jgi:hypothetical protein